VLVCGGGRIDNKLLCCVYWSLCQCVVSAGSVWLLSGVDTESCSADQWDYLRWV